MLDRIVEPLELLFEPNIARVHPLNFTTQQNLDTYRKHTKLLGLSKAVTIFKQLADIERQIFFESIQRICD